MRLVQQNANYPLGKDASLNPARQEMTWRLLQLPQRRRSLRVLRLLPRVHDLYVTLIGT